MGILRRVAELFSMLLILILSPFVKRRENRIAIGSWSGDRYVDNSRYLMEYLDASPEDYVLYWVGKKEIRDEVLAHTKRVVFLEINTFRTNLKLLSCKYFFFSQMHSADISRSHVYKNAVLCYLHHGMPIKKWAGDGLNQGAPQKTWKSRIKAWLCGTDVPYDYFVTSSPLHDATNCTALAFKGCTAEKNLPAGTPRNDMLIHYDRSFSEERKRAYADILGFDPSQRVILYLPTYRRISDDVFTFADLSWEQAERVQALLEEFHAVLIEKSHCAEKKVKQGISTGNIRFADAKINVQEMLLFADVMISDYSGAYLDFALLDRPILHFAYDYEYYKNTDSGLYYDIEDFSAGEVAYTYDDLICALRRALSGEDPYKEKRTYVRKKYMTYEAGNSSERIVHEIIKKEINHESTNS